MNESRHPIDDLFRDGLNQHSVEPPMHVWERIDQTRTPVYKLVNNFKQNSRWYLSVAAGLVLMSSAAIMFLSDNPENVLAEGGTGSTSTVQNQTEVNPSSPSSSAVEPYQGTTEPTMQNEETNQVNIDQTEPSSSNNPDEEIADNPSENNAPRPGRTVPAQNGGRTSPPVNREFGTEKRVDPKPIIPDYSKYPVPAEPVEEAPKGPVNLVPSTTPAEQLTEVPEVTPEEASNNPEAAPAPEDGPAKEQEVNAPPKERSPWAIEVLGSYDFVNRSITNASASYINTRNSAETLGSAFTLQLRGQYRFSDILSLRSGVSFSQINETLNYNKTTYTTEIVDRQETGIVLDPINGPMQVTYTVRDTLTHSNTTSYYSKNRYLFVDVPVLLNYTFYTSNNWKLGVSGGPMFNLAFQQSGSILGPENDDLIQLNSPANPFRSYAGVNLMLNMSAAYSLNKHFDVLVEPGVRYGIGSLTNKEFGMSQKYSSINLFTGIRYNF